MKIYECIIDKYTSTTLLADEIFNLSDEYTGIAFYSDVIHFTSEGLIKPVLFAVFSNPHTYRSSEYNNYCTMTDFKKYLTSITMSADNKNFGVGFITEIKQALSANNFQLEIIKPFKQSYPIHIQRSQDYQTYGNYSKTLYLTHFMLQKYS